MLLVTTKLQQPSPAGPLIERSRLLDFVDGQAPIALISAPAGYGKSTLLLQAQTVLEKRGCATAWLALDEMDTDGGRLLVYVASALEKAGIVSKSATPPLDTSARCDASLLAWIINAIESYGSTTVLLLDDVHLLSAQSMATLAILIERAPNLLRVVLTSRAVPELRLARYRATGRLCEIGMQELRFTLAETASFLQAEELDAGLDDRKLEQLEKRTEGWITGIRFFSLALRRGIPFSEALKTLSGSYGHIAEFFAQEVFAAQSGEMRDFLMRTSVLDVFSADLSEHLTGVSGAALKISGIERLRLFVSALDAECSSFRYHRLFAEFLRHKLREESGALATTLHRQASEWCWSNGRWVEAIKHEVRGGNMDRAASLLDLRCHGLIHEGNVLQLLKLIQQIPQEALRPYPRVLLTLAWLHAANLRVDERLSLIITTARQRIEELRVTGSASEPELQELEWLALHREAIIDYACDRIEELEMRCETLINTYPQSRPPYAYLITTTYAQLLFTARQKYQLGKHERLILLATGVFNRSPCTLASVSLQASIGISLSHIGKTAAGVETLELALAAAIQNFGSRSSLNALAALPLAQIFYEMNQLDRAAQLLQDTLHLTSEMEFVEILVAGFLTSARICRIRGDDVGAERALDQAGAIAVERQLARLRCSLLEERVRWLLQDGNVESAARYLLEAGIIGAAKQFLPRGEVTTQIEQQAMIWVRVAQGEGRTWDAILVARHWRNHCASRGATRSLVCWNIQLAKALSLQGDVRAAKRALREAIAQAARVGIIRSFLDEGPVVRHLLKETYTEERDVAHPTNVFAAELVAAFEGLPSEGATPQLGSATPSVGLNGRLTPKEHDILVLVSNGMSNREIAETVGMTEGSVKWYMQRVYDKVGTRRRLQAVERARKFGLIS